jgi:hypothetical protein
MFQQHLHKQQELMPFVRLQHDLRERPWNNELRGILLE